MDGTLFVDHVSQPSRACMLFCRVNKLDVQERLVNIAKGGTRTDEYKAMNPLCKVPYFQAPDGWGLAESAAILQYLADQYHCAGKVSERWYPKDLRTRAQINAVMAWHGSTLRTGSMLVGWHLVVAPNLGRQSNIKLVQDYGIPTLKEALRTINDVWLSEGRAFLVGHYGITIADLLLACEVEQLKLLEGNLQGVDISYEKLIAPYPKVTAWMDNVRQACGCETWNDVHRTLYKMVARMKSRL